MRKITASFILSVLVLGGLNAAPAKAFDVPSNIRQTSSASEIKDLVMPWIFYRRLSQCEVGRREDGSFRVDYQSRSYTSMFGIARGTFNRFSNHSSSKGMTAIEQARVVDKIAFLGHTEPDGEYVWPVGPYGWAVIKQQNCMNLREIVCKAKHPKVQRWKRYCK
jgi:hypothetical protein